MNSYDVPNCFCINLPVAPACTFYFNTIVKYIASESLNNVMPGRSEQKERERKRSAASCQRIDKLFAKKSKRVEPNITDCEDDISTPSISSGK